MIPRSLIPVRSRTGGLGRSRRVERSAEAGVYGDVMLLMIHYSNISSPPESGKIHKLTTSDNKYRITGRATVQIMVGSGVMATTHVLDYDDTPKTKNSRETNATHQIIPSAPWIPFTALTPRRQMVDRSDPIGTPPAGQVVCAPVRC